jgi:hypothetical protein
MVAIPRREIQIVFSLMPSGTCVRETSEAVTLKRRSLLEPEEGNQVLDGSIDAHAETARGEIQRAEETGTERGCYVNLHVRLRHGPATAAEDAEGEVIDR